MRYFKMLALAAVCSLAALPALAQDAGQTIDVGGWKVKRLHKPDGSFQQCSASFQYDDKSILAFAATAEQKVYLVVIEPDFKLTEGQTYQAKYGLDGKPAVTADAVAADATTLVIPVAADDVFMKGAMTAGTLKIAAGGQTIEEPLDGSKDAITQLGKCAMAAMSGK